MKTETNAMAEEIGRNTTPENRARLAELIKAYDDALTGYNAQEEQSKAIYNRVLAENDFRALLNSRDGKIKTGDRVTNEIYDYLLSQTDFDRLLNLVDPLMVEAGIVDEKGYYITDWLGIKGDARRALVAFFIDTIAPEVLRISLSLAKGNITQEHKLIEIARKIA